MPFDPFSETPPQPCDSPLRRRLITGLGLAAGAAALGIPGSAGAITWPWQRSSEAVDLRGLSSEWLAREGAGVRSYASFIDGLRLRNISTRQVVSAHAKRRGSVWNALPPRAEWRNIGETLKVLDRVSRELNVPVTEVVSVYRTPAYNARCAGAKRNSWHTRNYAVDVKMGARPSTVASMARRLRDRGHFRGGVGRYWNFTHVDTRGCNVDW